MVTKKTEIKETGKNVTKAPAKTEVKAPVKAEVKTEIKTETTVPKAEEVKAEVKAEVKEEAKKAPAKKEPAKKAPAKKATPAKAAKAEIKTALYVQFAGNEVTEADIIDKVKAAYVAEGHKESAIKEINLYVKPEEYAVYYVINDKAIGKVNLF
ncbi:DUF6465 family protein [Eshraghiella crossota]|jgi:hypothetical protein|uniref:Uncharacterized protein n=1 Tax=Eshraghiella crossota DSM 2876 TaxID=511680 RepID=D4S2K6_9FIRM|nr:DUF6465 family protein [Butyrivibrio crossotus]EFF67461.1 hypothetical protein BUTYVIB_02328 [Butyrivibrio crossotus DSM 2876]UWO51183.1 DUF6465 family protein [Butyrivibrio crossotus]